MLKNENIKVMNIEYKGKLNPAVEWYKFRNPIGMLIRGSLNEVFKKLPPCEFKNILYRLMGAKIGRNVCLSPDVHIDPLFPELVYIEDNVILGWGVTLPAHDINQDKLILGRIKICKNSIIGGYAQIRAGVTIKRNAIIGARSYVNKDIQSHEFSAGVPAKVIRKIYPLVKYKNIGEFLEERSKLGNKIFLIYTEDESRLSYKEFYEQVNRIANLLLSLGIKKGDKVSCIIHDCKEFICLLFGAVKIGVVFNPINPNLAEEELKFIITHSESKILFVNKENYEKTKAIKKSLINLEKVFVVGSKDKRLSYEENIKKFSGKCDMLTNLTLENSALIMYSSGTTGNPKGIILSHGNILYEGYSLARAFGIDGNTTSMVSNPLFFSGGLFPAFMSTFCAGGTIVLNKKFSKSRFWQRIEKHKVNFTAVVPTMLSILLNPPDDTLKYNLENCRFIACGAAPLPIELLKRFEQTFHIRIHDIYGLTENTGILSFNPLDLRERRIGSVGLPLDINEIKIFDKNDNELEPYKEGEIVARGPNIFKGYFKLEEQTREALKNGWLHTGDLGYKDNDGYLYITGRIKEIIKKGGELISPVAIDNVFYRRSNVKDSATIGVPDKIYGEEIVTFVVLKESSKTSKKELLDFCKMHVAEFKCPKEIIFVDEIPKTPSGKVLRRELARIWETHHS